MAESTLSILVKATGAIQAARDIGKVDSAVGKLGKTAAMGAKTALANIGRLGLVAGGAIAFAVKQGIDSLAELEQMENATAAVIESTGAKAGVTAQQVRDLAQAQESLTTADDRTVQAGENMLLTFTNIGGNIFPRATAAMVNMGIAMNSGSVEGLDLAATAIQLGKALNDPIKGATALRKVGVALTDEQTEQIKTLVKAGKLEQAQTIILKELETEFGKAGEAAGKGFGADMRRAADAVEDAKAALATGFLPVITKVTKLLSEELAKPSTIAGIKAFGTALAGGLERLIDVARGLPWGAIGDSLRIAGIGAKVVFDAFMAMPPWVQTAVLTGWGLNKLTGGALGSIVGQLASGLIKGVLGINAGVVNINAGVVNGGGAAGKGLGAAGFLAPGLGALAAGIALPLIMFALPKLFEKPGTATGLRNTPAGNLTATQVDQFSGLMPSFRRLAVEGGAVPVRDQGTVSAIDALADQRRGEIMEGRASTATLHAFLNELIGKHGGSFLRSDAEQVDENAGQLVDLFRTSTNPSLKSMQANLGILKGLAASGDAKTRAALSADIKALQALIDAKLAELIAATKALSTLTTGNQGWVDWRHGEQGAPVMVQTSVTADSISHAVQVRRIISPARAT